ncbi:MAG: Uncharacterized protein K0R09_3117 [Clostridiales bacterium]|jgi:hypothetical protein|nr:Uncharacterized protein [Clostridiales bacterium]
MKNVLNLLWEYRFLIMFAVWVVTYACTSWEKFKSNIKSGMLAAKQMSKEQILKSGKEQ